MKAAFQWLRVGVLGVCILLRACVDVSMCFQEGNSSVCMVCRPCAGLWGVDCWVRNRGLLMLGLGIWLRCVSLCLHSLTVSACLSSSFHLFSFFYFFHLSLYFYSLRTRHVFISKEAVGSISIVH